MSSDLVIRFSVKTPVSGSSTPHPPRSYQPTFGSGWTICLHTTVVEMHVVEARYQ